MSGYNWHSFRKLCATSHYNSISCRQTVVFLHMHSNRIFHGAGNRTFTSPHGHVPQCFFQYVPVPCGLSDQLGPVKKHAMGLLPTANQPGKLPREEWRRLSSRAIAARDGQAGTVHLCHVLVWEKVIPIWNCTYLPLEVSELLKLLWMLASVLISRQENTFGVFYWSWNLETSQDWGQIL